MPNCSHSHIHTMLFIKHVHNCIYLILRSLLSGILRTVGCLHCQTRPLRPDQTHRSSPTWVRSPDSCSMMMMMMIWTHTLVFSSVTRGSAVTMYRIMIPDNHYKNFVPEFAVLSSVNNWLAFDTVSKLKIHVHAHHLRSHIILNTLADYGINSHIIHTLILTCM